MFFISGKIAIYYTAITANLLIFFSGTCISWSSPIVALFEGPDIDRIPLGRNISNIEGSWIGALSPFGGIIGPILFYYVVEKVGRKWTLLFITIPFVIAFTISAFARTIELFYLARILMGIGIGGSFSVVPVYLGEIGEDSNRGILLGFVSVFLATGIFLTYCIGSYLSVMVFNLVLAVLALSSIPLIIVIIPESPYYLIQNNKIELAIKSLQYLHCKSDEETQKELFTIKSHLDQLKQGFFLDIFRTKPALKAFIYSVVLTTLQEFSGINVILFYAHSIFNLSGSSIPSEVCSIIIGFTQVVVSLFLPVFLDRVGRKLMLLVSLGGAFIVELLQGLYFYFRDNGYDIPNVNWLPVLLLLLFIVFFNMGCGPIPWAVMAEILPSNIKSKAALPITSFHWFTTFLLTFFLGDLIANASMASLFLFFASFCLLFFLFVFFFMFETKGKSFAEIQAILSK